MSIQLIEALEKAVASEDLATAHMPDASVRVQFAAGDWHKVCEALKAARAEFEAKVNDAVSQQFEIADLKAANDSLTEQVAELNRKLEDASKLPPPLLNLDTGNTEDTTEKPQVQVPD